MSRIWDDAFADCTSLTEIYALGTEPPACDSLSTFDSGTYVAATLYVPEKSLSAYKSADVWKEFMAIKTSPDATGIGEIVNEENRPDVIYDLQGRRLKAPKRGLNIINGKKVFIGK